MLKNIARKAPTILLSSYNCQYLVQTPSVHRKSFLIGLKYLFFILKSNRNERISWWNMNRTLIKNDHSWMWIGIDFYTFSLYVIHTTCFFILNVNMMLHTVVKTKTTLVAALSIRRTQYQTQLLNGEIRDLCDRVKIYAGDGLLACERVRDCLCVSSEQQWAAAFSGSSRQIPAVAMHEYTAPGPSETHRGKFTPKHKHLCRFSHDTTYTNVHFSVLTKNRQD